MTKMLSPGHFKRKYRLLTGLASLLRGAFKPSLQTAAPETEGYGSGAEFISQGALGSPGAMV